jgi:competence protein ComEC
VHLSAFVCAFGQLMKGFDLVISCACEQQVRFTLGIERARVGIATRIADSIGGPAGGVAAALATGQRGGIPENVRDDMRDSGLAHLLAISGLHLGLVAGFVFALVRGGLALWPRVALG